MIPILVIADDQDIVVLPRQSQYLAEELGAAYIAIPGCGHALEIQEPEIFNSLLFKHLSDADP